MSVHRVAALHGWVFPVLVVVTALSTLVPALRFLSLGQIPPGALVAGFLAYGGVALLLTCPRCGRHVYAREGYWMNGFAARTCTKCGLDLTRRRLFEKFSKEQI